MRIEVKICGLSTPEAIEAAARGGARFVGFVFYPPSPRHVAPARAAALARRVPAGVRKVGVVVDPSDSLIAEIRPMLDMLQLHGACPPARLAEIRARFDLPVIKALSIARAADLAAAPAYVEVADWLMFDAKPPPARAGALPGGNAVAFDWRLLRPGPGAPAPAGRRPWMLSGGLTVENLAEAVAISGARVVDVSSGVEDKPGIKSLDRIRAFLAAAEAASARGAA